MRALKAGFVNEVEKIFCRKKYKILLIIFGIFCILAGLIARYANEMINMSISHLPLSVLAITVYVILPLTIFMTVADVFTAEQENGTIKAVLTRPTGLVSIFGAKILAVLVYCSAVLGVCMVISSVFAMISSGMSPLDIVRTVVAYVISLVPMLPLILFAVLISQIVKSSSAAAILPVLGYVGLIALGTSLSGLYPMLFTSYTGWYKLFVGAFMPVGAVLNVFALLIAYTLLLFAAGGTLFRRKEY